MKFHLLVVIHQAVLEQSSTSETALEGVVHLLESDNDTSVTYPDLLLLKSTRGLLFDDCADVALE
jgi:hypothetical protein